MKELTYILYSFFFVFVFPLFFFCFVILYYHYLYHHIDTIVIACICVCVFCLLNNLFLCVYHHHWFSLRFFFSLSHMFICDAELLFKKNTFVFLIIIFSSIIISDIFDVAFFCLFFAFALFIFLLSSNKDLKRYLLLLFIVYRFLDDDFIH
jgi:hypothetical protein